MKILFSSSLRGRKRYQSNINLILETLEAFPNTQVLSPTKLDFQTSLPPKLRNSTKDPGKNHYQQTKFGINLAQACIFEVSHESFQIGYETTLAIQNKIPVLCLSSVEDFSSRITNDYFFGAKYNNKTLKPIIQDFLAHARGLSQAQRFNLFLYPHQINHIEKTAPKHNMNKSEYLRHLINQDRQQS